MPATILIDPSSPGLRRDDLNVPPAVKLYADEVAAVTAAVRRAPLDDEYPDLCRGMVAKLGRRRPSPLTRGDLRIWAAGVYAVGRLNFAFDTAQSPHASADELSDGWADGLVIDVRMGPRELQVQAFELGQIFCHPGKPMPDRC